MRARLKERLRQRFHVDAVLDLENSFPDTVLFGMTIPAQRYAPAVTRFNPGPSISPHADVGAFDGSSRAAGAARVLSYPFAVSG